jgi:uncharacterized membrane protein
MTILIVGLALFFGSHMIAWWPAWHDALVAKLGRNPYRGLVSLLSAVALVLIVIGYGRAPYEPVYVPPSWGRTLTLPLVFLAMVLLPAANMKSNLKRVTRHPMLWGVTAWGVGHLLVRGDARALLLFGGFVLYALLAMWSANRRGAALSTKHYAWRYDLIVIAAGVVAFLVLGITHRWLIGVPALY